MAAILAIAAAGCGGEAREEKVSPELVAGAIAKVNFAGGVQVRLRSESTNDASEGEKTAITGSGVIDLYGMRGSLRIDMRELAMLAEEAEGRDLNAAEFIGEIRVYDLKLYRRLPFLTKGAGIRQEWIASDRGRPYVGAQGVDFGQLSRINGNDLPQTFDDMTHLVEATRRPDEHRTVAGVETTRHDAKVNIVETPGGRDAFRSLTGATQYPVTVWIDEKGFARAVEWKVRHKVTTADPNRLQNSERTVEVTIERIGVPVRVKPPPKRDTIDQSKVGGIGI